MDKHPLFYPPAHYPWQKSGSNIWLASHFTLKRNLLAYPFTHKMEKKQKKQLVSLIEELLLHSPLLNSPTSMTSNLLSSEEKEILNEYFFLPKKEEKEGAIVDLTSSFLSIIGGKEHLLLQTFDSQSNWKEGWQKLEKIEETLSQKLDFAYSPTFGYLTSDPSSGGTALTIQAYLHLPALLHFKQMAHSLQAEEEILARGIGPHGEFVGNLVIIENQFTLGTTENQILKEIHKTATTLMNQEKKLRNQIKANLDPDLFNKVSRALGLLLYAHQLEAEESLNALSLLKLGIDVEWIAHIDELTINKLFFTCQSGHLTKHLTQSIEEEPQKRANLLKRELQNATLNL